MENFETRTREGKTFKVNMDNVAYIDESLADRDIIYFIASPSGGPNLACLHVDKIKGKDRKEPKMIPM